MVEVGVAGTSKVGADSSSAIATSHTLVTEVDSVREEGLIETEFKGKKSGSGNGGMILGNLAGELVEILPVRDNSKIMSQGQEILFPVSNESRAEGSTDLRENKSEDQEWKLVQGNKASTLKVAELADQVTMSPSRFQILINFREDNGQEEGEIPQEPQTKHDETLFKCTANADVGEDPTHRNLRPRSLIKTNGNLKDKKKVISLQEDKRVTGQGKKNKASGRKH